MLHDIPEPIARRMTDLEREERELRASAPPERWLRALQPEAARLVALLAASAPPGPMVELGTGAGYATLWLALASTPDKPVLTVERDPARAALGRETFALTGLTERVRLVVDDAVAALEPLAGLGFALVDHGPRHYLACWEPLVARLRPGALVVVDNILSHPEVVAPFRARVLSDPRVDATVVPVGKGLLVARRVG